MFNRKLRRRIRSLEESLNLRYSPKDGKDDYDEHVPDEYGRITDYDKLVKESNTKK